MPRRQAASQQQAVHAPTLPDAEKAELDSLLRVLDASCPQENPEPEPEPAAESNEAEPAFVRTTVKMKPRTDADRAILLLMSIEEEAANLRRAIAAGHHTIHAKQRYQPRFTHLFFLKIERLSLALYLLLHRFVEGDN